MLDLIQPTMKTDLPKKKKAAIAPLALVPDLDCTIWSDGTAKEGTIQGGGGAILELHREGRTIQCVAPAGRVCSSMRAELVAKTKALTRLHELPSPPARSSREACSAQTPGWGTSCSAAARMPKSRPSVSAPGAK